MNADRIPEEIISMLTPAMAAKKREQEAAERKAKDEAERAAKAEEAAKQAEAELQKTEVEAEDASVEDVPAPPEQEVVIDAVETDESDLGPVEPVDSESKDDESDV